MKFMVGCNYWASNAGTEMWREFDEKSIRKDLEILSRNGLRTLRVFPIWRDFQPVIPILRDGADLAYYEFENGAVCENECYLDEVMLDRFEEFSKICEEFGMQLIVGLITGWMSGRTFIPSALFGKNLLTDPTALYLEQLFIKGFIARFRECKAICAWDLGNECNCLGPVCDRYEALNWTASISNAIRAADPTRPVISGMHGLKLEGVWNIQDQAMHTDMLTTHPYAYFFPEGRPDETLSYRTSMFPTAQTKYYQEIGGKPCMAEEVNTIGPMVCSYEKQADYMRLNLFSLWANGATGLLWWCANDQDRLNTHPYTENMLERELGLITSDVKEKPALKEMKGFSEFMNTLDFALPPAKTDVVCILTREQNQMGVQYMTHALAKKAGFNCRFCYAEQPLPQSDVYMLPSVNGQLSMPKRRYDELKARVYEGAQLYLSVDAAIFSGFTEFSGMKVIDSYRYPETRTMTFQGHEIPFDAEAHYRLEPAGAQVLACDNQGNPTVCKYAYGKGTVWFVNFPLEKNLISKHDAFSGNEVLLYRAMFESCIKSYPVRVLNDGVVLTYHEGENGEAYAVLINHSAEEKELQLELSGVEISKVYYGDVKKIRPYDACVWKLKQK